MVQRKNGASIQSEEEVLAGQIPEYVEETAQPAKPHVLDVVASQRVDTSMFDGVSTGLGKNIRETADIRDGWVTIDRSVLGKRDVFYPEDWEFRIKPATVEAVRNWSTLDEKNINSIDDTFNEMLKYCLQIKTGIGLVPWGNINSWDRLFFILLIREVTFAQGEKKIAWSEECIECEGAGVEFTLSTEALEYELPDDELLKYYDRQTRTWHIDPADFGIEGDPIVLYNPTVEKEANLKSWMMTKYQELEGKVKFDPVFNKFVVWMAPKLSKDYEIIKGQIRSQEMKFKSWDVDMFSFMDDVYKNIIVTPSTYLKGVCPNCGAEMTSKIRFQDGVSTLFNMGGGHKKFGSK